MFPTQAFKEADLHHRAGRLDEAERLYRVALGAQPDAAEIWHRLAILSTQKSDLPSALRLAAEAQQRNPTSVKILLNKGAVELAMGRHAAALASFDLAIAVAPDDPDVVYNRGLALLGSGRAVEALTCFERVLARSPTDSEALSEKGIALTILRRHDEAERCFARVVELAPKRASAYINRGANAIARARAREALALFETACALEPGSSLAHLKRGDALAELERLPEALAAIDMAIELDPQNTAAQSARADVLAAFLAQSDEAIAAYDRGSALSPEIDTAQDAIRARAADEIAQRRELEVSSQRGARNLVWFLTLSEDEVGGGVMSICSIYDETRRLAHIHRGDVVASTYPRNPPLRRYTKFQNSMPIAQFHHVRAFYRDVENIILHIPETYCRNFPRDLSTLDREYLGSRRHVHINILLQNIDYIAPEDIEPLRAIASKLTCTTAHERYTNAEVASRFGITLHRLSVFYNEQLYSKRPFQEKEDVVVVSPDESGRRADVLRLLQATHPELKIVVVRDMRYEDYKDLVARAKWSLTFGEGLDAYFAEMAWSGGVPFAVFNDRFFTADFRDLPTVYPSWEDLMLDMPDALRRFGREPQFSEVNAQIRRVLGLFYRFDEYQRNLRLFYEGKYTFPRQ